MAEAVAPRKEGWMGAWRVGQMPGNEKGEYEDADDDEEEEEEESVAFVMPEKWRGKTILRAVRIRAEIGRTYSQYLCVVFMDGTRALLGLTGNGITRDAQPSISEMRRASDFYSPEDIADRVLQSEKNERTRRAEKKRSKHLQIERLYNELARMEE